MNLESDRTTQPTARMPRTAEKLASSRRSAVLVSGLLALALGLPAALAVTGGFGAADPQTSRSDRGRTPAVAAGLVEPGPQVSRSERARTLVLNGGFEDGTTGWRTNRPGRHLLTTTSLAAEGRSAARLSVTHRGRVVLHDVARTVGSAKTTLNYQLAAMVRAPGEKVRGNLRLREYVDGEVVGTRTARFRATNAGWAGVDVNYVAVQKGSTLDLRLVGRLGKRKTLLVDNVVLRVDSKGARPSPGSRPTTAAAPLPSHPDNPGQNSPAESAPGTTQDIDRSEPEPTSPDQSDSGGCVANAMGIPRSGAYLGAAVNGTSDIRERENRLGETMALHRTYYSGGGIAAAVRTAKADLALGRLPWISFKAPLSWPQMASGAGDAWVRELADGLKTVPGPVWLAVHHEPEKDGDMADWTAMQARIGPIIHDRTDNVAYSIIYSGWNTFGGGNNTIATKWPGDSVVDILAIDAYNDYGAQRHAKVGAKVLDLKSYYVKMAAWAKAHGTAWAIGETGQTRAAAQVDPTWLDRAYLDMVALGGAGLSYYDSSANSVADWTLDDSVKFARFKALLKKSERVC